MTQQGWKISMFASWLVLFVVVVWSYMWYDAYHEKYTNLEQSYAGMYVQFETLIQKHNEVQAKADHLERASLVYIHQIESLARGKEIPFQ